MSTESEFKGRTPPGASPKLKIDKVDAAPPGPEQSAWVGVLKSFNPLGTVAEMFAKTLAYRLESKRLAIEMERVRAQAAIATDLIDKSYRLKMEELEQRRVALNRYFDTVQQQLGHLHTERMQIMKMIEHSMKKTLEPGLSFEERRLFKEIVVELTSTLPQFAERANQSLQTLVQALPAVQMPAGLLAE